MNEKLIALILIAGIILAGIYIYTSNSAEVSAIGVAELEVEPDIVSIHLTLETRNETAEEAQRLHNNIQDKLLTELIKLGLERKEIQTVSYNINPEYDWNNGKREQIGFIARESIIIEIEDFDNIGSIVDKAIDSGAYVSWINFEISKEKQSKYKTLALEEAGKDAKIKATATAKGLGKPLGRLVSINSEEFYYNPYVYYDNAENSQMTGVKEAVMNISPRDITVRASIRVKYKVGFF